MYSIKTHTLLVCLVFLVTLFGGDSYAWNMNQADCPDYPQDYFVPAAAPTNAVTKVKPTNKIFKCKPTAKGIAVDPWNLRSDCILPMTQTKGWEVDAQAFFARTKGKVRFTQGTFSTFGSVEDVDINSDLGVPDHAVMGEFSISYRFRPRWSLRYSIMPMVMNGTGQPGRNVIFGTMTAFTSFQNISVKWERLQQSIALVYDPIHNPSSRVSLFGGYVRINERLAVLQSGFAGGGTFDNDMNMGMAALEFEKCLKQTRMCNTLSLECGAGVAFGDDGFGSDLMTGLKYSIPLNNGRWGFVKGGYRFMTYKKKYSDFKLFDTAMEGGFLQMGLVF
ncbi:MAG TPA: hypothetical protein VMC85_11830 [Desulfomonilaceae bacterium]|nr:hypothetical protein [Desulfomonilaceae bacterium]